MATNVNDAHMSGVDVVGLSIGEEWDEFGGTALVEQLDSELMRMRRSNIHGLFRRHAAAVLYFVTEVNWLMPHYAEASTEERVEEVLTRIAHYFDLDNPTEGGSMDGVR